ncbi:hypothetical protein V1478_007802, partial [Vespula squamosa]
EYFIVDGARKVTKHCYGPDLARAHFAAEFVISANKISLRLVGEMAKKKKKKEQEEEEEEEKEREVPQKERAASIDGPREVRGSRGVELGWVGLGWVELGWLKW